MFKNILNSTVESNLLPLIALIFFFAFFSFIVWNTFKMKKEVSDRMSQMPLNENNKLREV